MLSMLPISTYLCALFPVSSTSPIKTLSLLMRSNRIVPIVLFFALFISLSSVYAQQQWSFGPRLGVNFSRIIGDAPNNGFLPGFAGGLYLMYSDVNHFGISGDLLYSQKGGKYDFSGDKYGNIYDQRLNYIDIPVVARYFLNMKGEFRPNLFLGGNAAFLLNGKAKNRSINGAQQPDVDNTADFSSVEFGLVAGIGLNFKIAEGRWVQTDFRYQQGLTSIQSPGRNNATLAILFAYGIGFGKNYSK